MSLKPGVSLFARACRRSWALAGLALVWASSAQSSEVTASDLHGSWCFVEQNGYGRLIEEKVDIRFAPDGHYTWTEGRFLTEGRWKLEAGVLEMTKFGRLEVLGRPSEQWQLRMSGSTIRLVRGACPETGFSAQDRLEFHNAAFAGSLATVQVLLGRGLHPDTRDHSHGDTALIKAAKRCHVEVAKALLGRGADAKAVNDDGQQALDYAVKSTFHRGCPAMVELLGGKS